MSQYPPSPPARTLEKRCEQLERRLEALERRIIWLEQKSAVPSRVDLATS
jgi:hypothetical protein